jgi:hypothetical protein
LDPRERGTIRDDGQERHHERQVDRHAHQPPEGDDVQPISSAPATRRLLIIVARVHLAVT